MMESAMLQRLYDEIDANYTIDHVCRTLADYLYVPFVASFCYVALVFSGSYFMKNRRAVKLQTPLVFWNASLAIYSIITFVILAPPIYKDVVAHGFTYSMCNSPCKKSPWLSFWAFTFSLSKIVELGDTFFVIVRKAPLSFLHWYHHMTVLCYTWYALASKNEAGHWFAVMNLAVHSVMYTYYMLKAMKFNIPSRVALLVTILQLTQFVMGLIILVNATILYINNMTCSGQQAHLTSGFLMYGSYFLLFLNFFYNRYIIAKPRKTKSE